MRYLLNILCNLYRPGPRAGSSFVSSVIPHYAGSNPHTQEMIQVSHAFQRRPSNSPGMLSHSVPAVRRIEGPGGLPPVVPAAIQANRNGSFHIFNPHTLPVQNRREGENPLPNQFHSWERDHSSRFPTLVSDRDSAWVSYHHTASDSGSANRSGGLWHRQQS